MFLLDAHVHIYGRHQTAVALRRAVENLSALACAQECPNSSSRFGICLTETANCEVFDRLQQQLGGDASEFGYRITAAGERYVTVELPFAGVGPAGSNPGGGNQPAATLVVFAGRQIATSERLECLAFGSAAAIPDGLTFQDAADAIRAAGGLPMLPWGLGKWLLKREKTVREIILRNRPGELLICDSAVRPTLWPLPRLMRLAMSRGYTVVAGSDPFPLAGEEELVGSYATCLEAEVSETDPATDLLRLLTTGAPARTVGARTPVHQSVARNINLLKAARS